MTRRHPESVDRARTSPMLSVLLVYYEPTPAGQTKHVLALAQALARQGHQVTVVLPECLASAIAQDRYENIGLVPLPMRKSIWPRQSGQALIRLIRQKNAHIVHVHSLEAGLSGRIISWLAGLRSRDRAHIVYTPQTIDIRRRRWHWLYRWAECLLATVTDATISVNEADRQRLVRWGVPPDKTITIPNGIELEAVDNYPDPQATRRALGLDPSRPLVLQVARLNAQKDPLAFVEGASLAIRQCPDVQFAMLGQGPLKDAVASRIHALGLQHDVHLLGWHDRADRLMSAADVVTLTSRWEGSPYSLLEAMAASRPVVATAVNGCPEIVADGESGYLVPPGDVSAWSERVAQLLKHPRRASEMGAKGRQLVEQGFSIQATTSRILQLYQELEQ